MEKKHLIRDLVTELSSNNLAIFAGAGLSVAAGFVDWKDLLRNLAEDIGLDVDKEYDLITLAQYYVNEKNSRNKINQTILDEFYKTIKYKEWYFGHWHTDKKFDENNFCLYDKILPLTNT